MGHWAAHLNLLNKVAQRPQYAALLKKLNLPIEYWWQKIVFQNSARNFSFLRRGIERTLTRPGNTLEHPPASLDFVKFVVDSPSVMRFLEFATIE